METFQEHYDAMVKAIRQYTPNVDMALVDKAVEYAQNKHRDQKRKVSAALYRRGYSWDEIRSALSRFSSGSEDDYE